MTTIVISTSNVADFPEGGGHFWVYMQYVQALRALGCNVYWMEHFRGSGDHRQDQSNLRVFLDRMHEFGLAKKIMVNELTEGEPFLDSNTRPVMAGKEAERLCERADLLLNFAYAIDPDLLSRFKKTALIDIDPGLLQFWVSEGQLRMPRHDVYFSTGETVGKPTALFPSCGIEWHRIRPIVSLKDWPVVYRPEASHLTTVSGWWGGGEEGEWISNGTDVCYENNKRVSFMQFAELPCYTSQPLELALCMGPGDTKKGPDSSVTQKEDARPLTDYKSDDVDRANLEARGWKVRLANEVAADPNSYRNYIQESRGEFSCAKPSCMKFQNAWVSDRSLCYLASGKPVIVQNTGPSEFLPDAEGMFRFSTLDDALTAIDSMNSDYRRHCSAARELAVAHFDAEKILTTVLDIAL